MERIANAWRIAKASWSVLTQDWELLALPVLAGLSALLAFAAIAGTGFALLGGADGGQTSDVALWLVLALASVAAVWLSAIGQAAVVAGAARRMDGGDPTIRSALASALARAGRLLEWAVLATVVSIVLDQIEQRLGAVGRVVGWLGRTAFSVLSFLALPVIVFEDVGAIEAFKRSSRLLKRTWGEQLTFNFGIGLLALVLVLPVILLAGVLLASEVVVLQALGIVGGALLVIGIVTVTSTLSAIFKTALYRWASGLPVDPAFGAESLSDAFAPRRRA